MKPHATLAVRPPVDPAAAEAFLAGKPFPSAPAEPLHPPPAEPLPAPLPTGAAALPLSGRKVHERKDGRRVRRTTILMEEELARRLDLFAAARGVDKTSIHEAALNAWLNAHER